MDRTGLYIMFALLTWCAVVAPVRADEARVEVATLDAAPVYHWRTFKSQIPDDVDRALVLRDFQRKHFKLSQKIVDDAVQEEITKNYGGEPGKFAQSLRRQGVSTEDFRRFTSEEIVLSAMLYQKVPDKGDEHAQAEARHLAQTRYLSGLRRGATVKRFNGKPYDGE